MPVIDQLCLHAGGCSVTGIFLFMVPGSASSCCSWSALRLRVGLQDHDGSPVTSLYIKTLSRTLNTAPAGPNGCSRNGAEKLVSPVVGLVESTASCADGALDEETVRQAHGALVALPAADHHSTRAEPSDTMRRFDSPAPSAIDGLTVSDVPITSATWVGPLYRVMAFRINESKALSRRRIRRRPLPCNQHEAVG